MLARPAILLLLLALLAAAAPAFADEEDSSYVQQLRPEEVAFLEKRFPEWSKLDARRKEQVARNVVRLRDLSPEDREKLKRRMQQLHRRKERGMHPFRTANDVGASLQGRLPAEVQAQVLGLNVRPSMVRITLFRLVKDKAVADQDWQVSDEELAGLREPMRRRLASLLAQAREGESLRARMAARNKLRNVRLMGKLQRIEEPGELAGFWEPYAGAVLEEVRARPARFLDAVRRMSRYHMDRVDFEKSIWALERFASRQWKDDPKAVEAADRVVRNLLVTVFKADPEKVAALPKHDAGRARGQALRKLLGGRLERGGKGRRGERREGNRRRGRDDEPGRGDEPGQRKAGK